MTDDERPLVPEAEDEMQELKEDVAEDLDIPFEPNGDNGDLTARDLGKIGGTMVKRLIAKGETALDEEGNGPRD